MYQSSLQPISYRNTAVVVTARRMRDLTKRLIVSIPCAPRNLSSLRTCSILWRSSCDRVRRPARLCVTVIVKTHHKILHPLSRCPKVSDASWGKGKPERLTSLSDSNQLGWLKVRICKSRLSLITVSRSLLCYTLAEWYKWDVFEKTHPST